jgi:hypothetical protein
MIALWNCAPWEHQVTNASNNLLDDLLFREMKWHVAFTVMSASSPLDVDKALACPCGGDLHEQAKHFGDIPLVESVGECHA